MLCSRGKCSATAVGRELLTQALTLLCTDDGLVDATVALEFSHCEWMRPELRVEPSYQIRQGNRSDFMGPMHADSDSSFRDLDKLEHLAEHLNGALFEAATCARAAQMVGCEDLDCGVKRERQPLQYWHLGSETTEKRKPSLWRSSGHPQFNCKYHTYLRVLHQ